jgi:hypothetical protein
MVQCPDCQGRKGRTAYACPGFRPIHMPCEACSATGELTAEQAEKMTTARAAGEQMRQERIARRETLRDAAARLGVDVARYSRIEHGLESMP